MTAIVSLGVGIEIALAFMLFVVFLGVLVVRQELRRPLTAYEIAEELREQEDAWQGFEEARANHPSLGEMEVR